MKRSSQFYKQCADGSSAGHASAVPLLHSFTQWEMRGFVIVIAFLVSKLFCAFLSGLPHRNNHTKQPLFPDGFNMFTELVQVDLFRVSDTAQVSPVFEVMMKCISFSEIGKILNHCNNKKIQHMSCITKIII